MTKYIAILRGINVGGHRKILMADLKVLLKKIGLINCTTYIQSGNVIFSSDKPVEVLEKGIQQVIFKNYGFEVPVLVRTLNYFNRLVDHNPYVDHSTIDQLYVTFLSDAPKDDAIETLKNTNFDKDQFTLIGDAVFLCFNSNLSTSKLNNNVIERKLNVTATTRNWKTVLKLIDLSMV